MKTIHFQIGIACVSSQSYATHKSIIASFVVCLFFFCRVCLIRIVSVAFKVWATHEGGRESNTYGMCAHTRTHEIHWRLTYIRYHRSHCTVFVELKFLELLHVCHVSFSQHNIQLNTVLLSVWSVWTNRFVSVRFVSFTNFLWVFFFIKQSLL